MQCKWAPSCCLGCTIHNQRTIERSAGYCSSRDMNCNLLCNWVKAETYLNIWCLLETARIWAHTACTVSHQRHTLCSYPLSKKNNILTCSKSIHLCRAHMWNCWLRDHQGSCRWKVKQASSCTCLLDRRSRCIWCKNPNSMCCTSSTSWCLNKLHYIVLNL